MLGEAQRPWKVDLVFGIDGRWGNGEGMGELCEEGEDNEIGGLVGGGMNVDGIWLLVVLVACGEGRGLECEGRILAYLRGWHLPPSTFANGPPLHEASLGINYQADPCTF